jgi:hypothetical protein
MALSPTVQVGQAAASDAFTKTNPIVDHGNGETRRVGLDEDPDLRGAPMTPRAAYRAPATSRAVSTMRCNTAGRDSSWTIERLAFRSLRSRSWAFMITDAWSTSWRVSCSIESPSRLISSSTASRGSPSESIESAGPRSPSPL